MYDIQQKNEPSYVQRSVAHLVIQSQVPLVEFHQGYTIAST